MPNIVPQDAPGSESLTKSEHIGVTETGDNINAKKVASYGFGTDGNWRRTPLPLIDGSYDYVGFSNPDTNGNYQTIVFNSGGSGGSAQRTLTLGYDGNSNITSIART